MISEVKYLNNRLVIGATITDRPKKGQTISGYGRNLPTSYVLHLKYQNRKTKHRVFVMQYANAGSAYIKLRKEILFLDTETNYFLMGCT